MTGANPHVRARPLPHDRPTAADGKPRLVMKTAESHAATLATATLSIVISAPSAQLGRLDNVNRVAAKRARWSSELPHGLEADHEIPIVGDGTHALHHGVDSGTTHVRGHRHASEIEKLVYRVAETAMPVRLVGGNEAPHTRGSTAGYLAARVVVRVAAAAVERV